MYALYIKMLSQLIYNFHVFGNSISTLLVYSFVSAVYFWKKMVCYFLFINQLWIFWMRSWGHLHLRLVLILFLVSIVHCLLNDLNWYKSSSLFLVITGFWLVWLKDLVNYIFSYTFMYFLHCWLMYSFVLVLEPSYFSNSLEDGFTSQLLLSGTEIYHSMLCWLLR